MMNCKSTQVEAVHKIASVLMKLDEDGRLTTGEQNQIRPLLHKLKYNNMTIEKFNFGQAIEALKSGKLVCREGWNGRGMWLQLFSQSNFITVDCEPSEVPNPDRHGYSSHVDEGKIDHIGIIADDNGFYPVGDFILMKTAQNNVVPWLASQTDMLAEDWMILN